MSCQHYIQAHGGAGILTPDDIASLNEATIKVLVLMSDGLWHTADAILAAAGQREGLRRMRDLRRFCRIDRRRLGLARQLEYRLVRDAEPKPEPAFAASQEPGGQGELFASGSCKEWRR